MAIFACICPLMANVTAIGVLLYFGVRNGSILCITPFLILAVGKISSYQSRITVFYFLFGIKKIKNTTVSCILQEKAN